jgi:hypothetical protein
MRLSSHYLTLTFDLTLSPKTLQVTNGGLKISHTPFHGGLQVSGSISSKKIIIKIDKLKKIKNVKSCKITKLQTTQEN